MSNNISFSLETKYKIINPTISATFCSGDCNVTISNNCPKVVSTFCYFDIIRIKVVGIDKTFTYNILCDNSYITNTFEWGLLIIIFVCTILLIITTIYSKAWSIGGGGIRINYFLVIVFWIVLAIVGGIAFATENFIGPLIEVACLILGVAGVWVCSN